MPSPMGPGDLSEVLMLTWQVLYRQCHLASPQLVFSKALVYVIRQGGPIGDLSRTIILLSHHCN